MDFIPKTPNNPKLISLQAKRIKQQPIPKFTLLNQGLNNPLFSPNPFKNNPFHIHLKGQIAPNHPPFPNILIKPLQQNSFSQKL